MAEVSDDHQNDAQYMSHKAESRVNDNESDASSNTYVKKVDSNGDSVS